MIIGWHATALVRDLLLVQVATQRAVVPIAHLTLQTQDHLLYQATTQWRARDMGSMLDLFDAISTAQLTSFIHTRIEGYMEALLTQTRLSLVGDQPLISVD